MYGNYFSQSPITLSAWIAVFLCGLLAASIFMICNCMRKSEMPVRKQVLLSLFFTALVLAVGVIVYFTMPFFSHLFIYRLASVVIGCLIILFIGGIYLVICWLTKRWGRLCIRKTMALCLCFITLMSSGYLSEFIYPFDRPLKYEFCASYEMEVGEYRKDGFWIAIYDDYPRMQDDYTAIILETDETGLQVIEDLLAENTYLVAFERKIESVSYNIWDYDCERDGNGSFEGNVLLSEERHLNTVFVYKLPKIRLHSPLT